MAAHIKRVACVLSLERNALLRGCVHTVETKRYVRGLRRRPVQVLFPDSKTGKTPQSPQSGGDRRSIGKQGDPKPSFKAETCDGNAKWTSIGSDPSSTAEQRVQVDAKQQVGGLHFERAFHGDKRLSRVVSIAQSRTFREQQGKILLEGKRLICSALEAGANPQMLFFSTVDRLRELPLDKLKRATLVKVKFEDIKLWSKLVAPQGVIAIFSRPDPSRMRFPEIEQLVPLSLICDNIRDPGNLGTILRCAAAAGCQDVLLTKGCVDAWEPKVLRAAMGAHFHLPIYTSMGWDEVESHLPKTVTVHVADNFRHSDRTLSLEETQVNLHNKHSKAGDYGWVSTRPNPKNVQYEEYDSDSESYSDHEAPKLSLPRVDVKLYHERWAQRPTALVIGGETHGLSVEAVELAEKTTGRRLLIPVVPEVDSLNSAMAASILLFEGRRQLLNIKETPARIRKPKAQKQSQ
ncbi:rRNA methyltransferase 3A, mitochondrial [Lampris incognitus]|uniref:rRNA methyltransferase 3A, mitochondrial n=1 Tax=Lampris incognitus TaxID=2546036 RepID=UPI0024B5C927|nr:rRNA methyltransferase 3A, mitochondrial [Lampris incognitus]